MTPDRLRRLLRQVRDRKLEPDEALRQLSSLPFDDLGFAKVDHHRALRTGFPEVIFGAGKTPEQIIEITRSLTDGAHNVLITRLDAAAAARVRAAFPSLTYAADARVATLVHPPPPIVGRGQILVIAAGTSDLPVAEEAAVTATLAGNRVARLHDVGVSGIHRLFAHQELLREAAVLIVVAGMEGALPSVVAGLV